MLILRVTRRSHLTYTLTNPTTAGHTSAPETLQSAHHILPLGWTKVLSPQLVYALPSAARLRPRGTSIPGSGFSLMSLPTQALPGQDSEGWDHVLDSAHSTNS